MATLFPNILDMSTVKVLVNIPIGLSTILSLSIIYLIGEDDKRV